VAFKEEFPANYYPWLRLEAQRCGVEWLSIHDPLHSIERATFGAKLLAISFVQYLSGLRVDLNAIGEICHRNHCFFFVDAIQGLGAFPLNVRTAHIDALAADGHKWMLGPEGCGILYVQKDRQDSIFPKEFGWTNVAGYNDYASRDMTLRPDAGRYECGTLNTIGCSGLRASIELLLEVGIERIGPVVQGLADRLAEGARQKGYQVLGDRTPENGSGIVALHKPNVDSRKVVRDLKEHGIMAAPRQGWVRFSPHFYISPEEIDRVVEALP
jgi:selenocysteine lyase/cysteine desulfurase